MTAEDTPCSRWWYSEMANSRKRLLFDTGSDLYPENNYETAIREFYEVLYTERDLGYHL